MAHHNRRSQTEYELQETLGRGAFGVVKRCIERMSGGEFAAKIIDTRRMSKQDWELTVNEANICRMLKHEHIVRMHNSFQMRDTFVMIFDLITGGELFEDIVAREFYNESSACDCIRIILDAMAYCHEKNVMHRDLKPENILLASRVKGAPVKIADFGLAIRVPDSRPRRYGLAGTFAYMAPEVITNSAYNLSADIWSCGVILYLLLCGYPPFWDAREDNLQRKIVYERHNFPAREWNVVSPAARDLIDRMLDKDPRRRLSAQQALQHPWLRDREPREEPVHLKEAVIHLRKFNARRKWRGAVIATLAALRHFKGIANGNETAKDVPEPVNPTPVDDAKTPSIESLVIVREDSAADSVSGDRGEEIPVPGRGNLKILQIDERIVSSKRAETPTPMSIDDDYGNQSYADELWDKGNRDWLHTDSLNEYHDRSYEPYRAPVIGYQPSLTPVVPVVIPARRFVARRQIILSPVIEPASVYEIPGFYF